MLTVVTKHCKLLIHSTFSDIAIITKCQFIVLKASASPAPTADSCLQLLTVVESCWQLLTVVTKLCKLLFPPSLSDIAIIMMCQSILLKASASLATTSDSCWQLLTAVDICWQLLTVLIKLCKLLFPPTFNDIVIITKCQSIVLKASASLPKLLTVVYSCWQLLKAVDCCWQLLPNSVNLWFLHLSLILQSSWCVNQYY